MPSFKSFPDLLIRRITNGGESCDQWERVQEERHAVGMGISTKGTFAVIATTPLAATRGMWEAVDVRMTPTGSSKYNPQRNMDGAAVMGGLQTVGRPGRGCETESRLRGDG